MMVHHQGKKSGEKIILFKVLKDIEFKNKCKKRISNKITAEPKY
jgi:hypothetical protein